MRLVGYNFTKIQAERFKEKVESIKFNSKMNFSSIELVPSEFLKSKDEIVQVNFDYTLSYDPELAKVSISGKAFFSLDSKTAKEVIKGFKEKAVPEDFQFFILNILLKKVNLKALQLEEELNLPSHLPLISLSKENLKKK